MKGGQFHGISLKAETYIFVTIILTPMAGQIPGRFARSCNAGGNEGT
jgi:hypothetical protein